MTVLLHFHSYKKKRTMWWVLYQNYRFLIDYFSVGKY